MIRPNCVNSPKTFQRLSQKDCPTFSIYNFGKRVSYLIQICKVFLFKSIWGSFCTFSKILLKALDDTEESSAVGSAIVLKNFIRLKGSELFHAVPELVQDSLLVQTKSIYMSKRYSPSPYLFQMFSFFAGNNRLSNTTC